MIFVTWKSILDCFVSSLEVVRLWLVNVMSVCLFEEASYDVVVVMGLYFRVRVRVMEGGDLGIMLVMIIALISLFISIIRLIIILVGWNLFFCLVLPY